MKKSALILSLTVAAILSACVTINIYFPAAAAEKAADKIIDEVWQLKQGQPGSEKDGAVKPEADTPTAAPAK
jgi:pyruvate/2-oxoacid:ferredoxin oxidoreductase beta subunit